MIDRPRLVILSWAAACAVAFVFLSLSVSGNWTAFLELDRDLSDPLVDWASGRDTVIDVLRVIEEGTGLIGACVATAALALLLLVKSHRRAAIYAVVVMAATMISVDLLKRLIDRDRPPGQLEVDLLTTASYPSGHASYAAAFSAVTGVVIVMLLRQASVRRLLLVVLTVFTIVICLDRVLLGRHFTFDVVGGVLLGLCLALLGLVFFSPLPRGHAGQALPLVVSVPASKRDLAVVLNPVKVEDVGQFRSIVSAMAAEAGWSEPSWHYTSVEDPGTGQAHLASVEGADLVLVCGGDGTVREVCAELAGTGIPVGIVPAGTGNLLARNLDIPLYLRSAIDVALNGQDRAIDMVAVSGDGIEDTHFLVMAGMGFDAAIMEGVNEDIKKKVGWLAYVLSALKSLMFPAVRVEVSVDDGPFTKHRARTVVVGNVGFLQAGMPLLPNAAIDDGVIDVVLLHPKRFLSWIPVALRILTKRAKTDESIARFTGQKITVRAAIDTPRQLDGDSIGLGRELVMECVHGRLLVRVPR